MSYNGGKGGSGVFQKIISLIPPTDWLIELFAGSGVISRMIKHPAKTTVVEIDREVLNQFDGAGIPNLEIVHGDAFQFLRDRACEFTARTFVYADPPYPRECRIDKSRKLYQYEMFERDAHCELLTLLKALPCMVAVSSYWNPVYHEMLADWNLFKFRTTDRGGNAKIEHVWFNYPQPTKLQDYRFVGEWDRARWNLTKRKRRLLAKFKALPVLHQRAVYETLTEYIKLLG
jgi:site-specific DNA-adenine methylase